MRARTALEQLSEYRPDSAIVADITELLLPDEMIQVVDSETIHVPVRDGVAILSGYVIMLANKARAERLARQVPGVL